MKEAQKNGTTDAAVAASEERYPLDDALIAVLGQLREHRNLLQQEWAKLQGREQGALDVFSAQHKLTGQWRLADNGREIVKQADPPAQK